MKDSIYFSHDADARSDEKIISLIMAHGYEGYGIFWAIIEMLRTATNYKMQLDFKRIAFALHVDSKKVESIICDFELFDCIGGLHNLHECKDDLHKKTFFSKSLNRRMKLKESISEKRRQAAMARWNGDAKGMQMHSKSNAGAEQVQCNKGKKEKKENKINKEKKYTPRDARLAVAHLDWIDDKIWNEWIDFKVKVKASITERAIRKNIKQLRELGEHIANQVLEQSLDKGWKGLFVLKDQNQTMEQHGQEWLALAED